MQIFSLRILVAFIVFSNICIVFPPALYSQSGTNQIKLDSLFKLIQTDNPDSNKIIHLNELAWELMNVNLDTAILLNNQAIDLAENILNGSEGSVQIRIQKEMALSNSQLGSCHRLKGDYSLSLMHHFKALDIRDRLNDKKGISGTLYNIGAVYYSQGVYPKALEYFFKALIISRELIDYESILVELNSIGLIYRKQKDFDLALTYFSKAVKICTEIRDKNSIPLLLNNIGNIYNDQKKYANALKNYFEALKLAEEIGNKHIMAIAVGNIGDVYSAMGDYPNALKNHLKALALAEELGEKESISRHKGNIGFIFLKLKQYIDAERYLLEALAISIEIGALDLKKDNSKLLSDLYSETNRFELAYKYQIESTTAKDSLFNDEKSKDIGKLEARHEMEVAEMERIRKAEEELKAKVRKRERKNLLQYSGISVLLLIVGSIIVLLGFKKVSPTIASAVTFFAFLLLFEFLLVLLDPSVDSWSGGEPAYKLLFNAGIAALIFPLHAFFERLLKRKLIKK